MYYEVPIDPLRAVDAPAATAAAADTRILLVDDDETVRRSLGRLLHLRGYTIETAASAADALAVLRPGAFAVMLADIRMPQMTGLELLSRALATDPDLAVVMLTAVADARTATEALSAGAMDYLTKPIDAAQIETTLQGAIKTRRLRIQQRQVDQYVREEVAARVRELEERQAELRALTVRVAQTLVNAMEAKDPYMRDCSHRVSALAASIAEELGLDADTVEAVRLAGRLHDVGKIGIREAVLNKPGKLTPEEYAHVKTHVEIGMEILAPLRHLGVVLDYVHDHHEHYDGSGYPRGLAGEAISIGGRIL
ncbi:MAG: response regulator, partial [Gemmatimonadaceae bacterium]|nr:response regulator [Gemmatimonadaceae bacterium]